MKKVSDLRLLRKYLGSGSAHQAFLAATVIQEWAADVDARSDTPTALGQTNDAKPLADLLVSAIEGPPPATYVEMTTILSRIASECQALLSAFAVEGKVSKDKIPTLPKRVDPLSASSATFSLVTAQTAIGAHFDALAGLLGKNAQKTVLPSLKDRQRKVMGSIGYFAVMKERYDVQVSAAIAGALVALRVMPSKFGPVIKSVMDSIKVSRDAPSLRFPVGVITGEHSADYSQKEENEVLQTRSANSVSAFVAFCGTPFFTGKVNPCDKVIKNLWTFLCSDTSVTPVFSPDGSGNDGIITLKEERVQASKKGGAGGANKDEPEESEEQISMRVMRRGALEAFRAMARCFGGGLFDAVPKFWEGISAALLSSFTESECSGFVSACNCLMDR
jgi:TATA-binding protein-associated factor